MRTSSAVEPGGLTSRISRVGAGTTWVSSKAEQEARQLRTQEEVAAFEQLKKRGWDVRKEKREHDEKLRREIEEARGYSVNPEHVQGFDSWDWESRPVEGDVRQGERVAIVRLSGGWASKKYSGWFVVAFLNDKGKVPLPDQQFVQDLGMEKVTIYEAVPTSSPGKLVWMKIETRDIPSKKR